MSPVTIAMLAIVAALVVATVVCEVAWRASPSVGVAEVRVRIASWWVMAAVFLGALQLGLVAVVALYAAISGLALRELLLLVPVAPSGLTRLVAWSTIPTEYGLLLVAGADVALLGSLVVIGVAIPVVAFHVERDQHVLRIVGGTVFATLLTVVALGHAAFFMSSTIDSPAGGAGLVLFLVVVTEVGDVSQFLWGKLVGRRPIAPSISPNKTRGGLAGGTLTAAAISAAAAPLLTPMSAGVGALVGIGLALAGFLGDLMLSAVKRRAEVKDTGTLIPGHGGVLDRVDSLTMTAPLFFHFARLTL